MTKDYYEDAFSIEGALEIHSTPPADLQRSNEKGIHAVCCRCIRF